MFNWHSVVIEGLLPAVAGDKVWEACLRTLVADENSPTGLHLAIFVEPYLTYVLDGKKTVESRFGVHRNAPYGQVAPGDVILLKRSSGPILGVCKVSDVWFYCLDPGSWTKLRKDYADALCARDPGFWEQRKRASFATLMRLDSVRPVPPIEFVKQDRRGWVVLRSSLGHGGMFSH
jgi:hypothetical protein